jgi:hypothetical protein
MGQTTPVDTVPAAPTADSEVDETTTDALLATKLFLEGRKLLKQHKAHAACPLLERSHQLAPSLATVLNLALCHQESGRLATAHDYYRRAETMATLAADPRRQEVAHKGAADLTNSRASLVLQITGNADLAFEVRLDGIMLVQDGWKQPIFLDAGEHRIAVQAPGYQPWQGNVAVQDGGKHVIVVPELRPGTSAIVPEAVAPQVTLATDNSAKQTLVGRAQQTDPGPNTGRIVALSVGGAGIAALGASLIFGIVARTTYDKSDCNRMVCDAKNLEIRNDALAHASRATVLGISGGAALAGGIILWFLSAPDSRAEQSKAITINAGYGTIGAEWRGTL